MFETHVEETRLIQAQKSNTSDEQQKLAINERLKLVHHKKIANTLNLLKNLGDMVTASQAIGLPRKLFGFDFNDGQVGLGGLTSALITCYQLYPAKK